MSTDDDLLARTLPRAARLIETARERGWQIGTQAFVKLGNETVLDVGVGLGRAEETLPDGSVRPAAAMTRDTIVLWLSATKPLAAAAILQRLHAGELGLDDPVVRFIPEFGTHGKDAITLRHLMLHTAGFRWVDLGDSLDDADILDRICRARLERDWTPGRRAGYHPYTSWYVLGEVLRRLTGLRFDAYVRREIFAPLGMTDCRIGIPPAEVAALGDRLGILLEITDAGRGPHRWCRPEAIGHGPPGAGGFGPIRQLARFHEALLHGGELDGGRILPPHLADWMTEPQRVGMFDETFKHKLDFGLGLILNSNRHGAETVPYNYGRHAGPRTFGHSGNQSTVAFADPAHDLIAAFAFNGMCGERNHQVRVREVLSAMYLDLGLA